MLYYKQLYQVFASTISEDNKTGDQKKKNLVLVFKTVTFSFTLSDAGLLQTNLIMFPTGFYTSEATQSKEKHCYFSLTLVSV